MADPFTPEPDAPAPVAVVRRRGEGYDALDARKQGYTDEQVYGPDRSSSTRRGGTGALGRGYEIAAARELRQQQENQQRLDLAKRQQDLQEKEYTQRERLHASSLADKQTALDQLGYYLEEEDQLAQKFGRGSKEFLSSALSVARKYPAAIAGEPRLGEKLNYYDKTYQSLGGHPDLPQALWEVGQFDPKSVTTEQAQQYLGEIPGKYPGVANDKAFQDLLKGKAEIAAQAGAEAQAKAAGLVPSRSSITGPGGTTTLAQPRNDADKLLKSLENQQRLLTTVLTSAQNRRAKTGIDQDIIDDADKTITETSGALKDLEGQIAEARGSIAPDQPTTEKAAPAKIEDASNHDTQESFTKAFTAAKPGEVIKFKGKAYKKP